MFAMPFLFHEIDIQLWVVCCDIFVNWIVWNAGTIHGEADTIHHAAEISAKIMHKLWDAHWYMSILAWMPIRDMLWEKFHNTWASPGLKLRGIDQWEGWGK